MSNSSTVALIVAAGRGERAPNGSKPKQYRLLAGKPVLRWAIEAFVQNQMVGLIQVVIGADDRFHYDETTRGINLCEPIVGGVTRQESVLIGLEALKEQKPNKVLIHDGARPFVSQALIQRVVSALDTAEAAVPLLPVSDTIRRKKKSGYEIVAREDLRRAQTPQGFSFERILAAHRKLHDLTATDDMIIAEKAGMTINDVVGEEGNFKLTNNQDFKLAEMISTNTLGEVRTGTGFDVHEFSSGEYIWLCGVRIPHQMGLKGHSDADVGLHALTDAILGSICAGDIGVHFPPTDPQWRGVPSHIFLAKAVTLVRERGGDVVHVDVTLICEQPKVSVYRNEMRRKIAQILDINSDCVSVKATTTDGLGTIGRGEGIAAQAIATTRLRAT